MIFVDTSALYAVLDRDDDCHPRASDTWIQLLRAQQTLVTHNYVLIEICALAQSRLGVPALRAVQEDILPVLQVQWITEARHYAAVQMALAADRKKLSVVDCASFLVMREERILEVFAFDKHFGEQGFRVVPGG